MSSIDVIPVTRVTKIRGTISILIRLIKRVPKGLSIKAISLKIRPVKRPKQRPKSIFCHMGIAL
jgi:hypothetical protein